MKTTPAIAIFLVIVFLVYLMNRRTVREKGYQNISAGEVKKRLEAGEKGLIVDVRMPEEYAAQHIPHSLLIPLDRIEQEAAKKIPDKDTPLFLYCLTGRRSANGARILARLGYRNVYNMGAMMNWPGKKHKFDVSQKEKLDNPKRRAMLPPEETLRKLGLHEGEIMADIGCGIGYFTLPAARIIGSKGKVYALDISREMLTEVETKKHQAGVQNIELIQVDEYDLKLTSGSVKLGFICSVLHEIDDLARYLTEIRRILRNEGNLVIIEWEKRLSDFGPSIEHRLDKNDLIKILKEVQFKDIEIVEVGKEFYGIKARL